MSKVSELCAEELTEKDKKQIAKRSSCLIELTLFSISSTA